MKQFVSAFKKIWPLERCNHKVNNIEKDQWFLNETQAITGQDHGIHDVFIQNIKISQYAQNSSPINDTDVMHRVADVGREFIFTLDIELLTTPTLNPDDNKVLFKYLRDVSTNYQFSIYIL